MDRVVELEAELQKARNLLRDIWLAMRWPEDWINHDGTAKNATGALQPLPELIGRIYQENEQLLKNAGFGGYSSSAPEEMWVYGMGDGCDTWIHLDRATVMNGEPEPTVLEKRKSRGFDGPVKYIRWDIASGKKYTDH